MEKFKSWPYGVVATVLVGSAAWAWQFAFSTEARLTKTETIIVANVQEQKEFRERVLHTLDRLENKLDKIQESKMPVMLPPKQEERKRK